MDDAIYSDFTLYIESLHEKLFSAKSTLFASSNKNGKKKRDVSTILNVASDLLIATTIVEVCSDDGLTPHRAE